MKNQLVRHVAAPRVLVRNGQMAGVRAKTSKLKSTKASIEPRATRTAFALKKPSHPRYCRYHELVDACNCIILTPVPATGAQHGAIASPTLPSGQDALTYEIDAGHSSSLLQLREMEEQTVEGVRDVEGSPPVDSAGTSLEASPSAGPGPGAGPSPSPDVVTAKAHSQEQQERPDDGASAPTQQEQSNEGEINGRTDGNGNGTHEIEPLPHEAEHTLPPAIPATPALPAVNGQHEAGDAPDTAGIGPELHDVYPVHDHEPATFQQLAPAANLSPSQMKLEPFPDVIPYVEGAIPFDVNQFQGMPAAEPASSLHDGMSGMEAYGAPQLPPATGFAKLEFSDGHFYMTTYAVELGRDMRAFKLAQQQPVRQQMHEDNGGKTRAKRSSSVPGTPARRHTGQASIAPSFISESGGIIGEDDGHINLQSRRKKSGKSKSTDTSSRRSQISRKNSVSQAHSDLVHLDAPAPTVDPGTALLDPSVHMPDPSFTPLIPIHPPKSAEEPFPSGKGISRKHVRIAYNFDRGLFEMTVQGRNGAFHDEDHYGNGEVVALHDGSQIEIGGVGIKFVLPNVPASEAEDDPTESQSGRMSFGFEDGRGESIIADDESVIGGYDSEPEQVHPTDLGGWEDFDDDDDLVDHSEIDEEESDDEVVEPVPKVKLKLKTKEPPPKMSKYSRKMAAKSAKAATKLKLKLNREKARAKREAEEREREREREREAAKAAKKLAKQKALDKEKAKAEKKDASKEPSKAASKEPSKGADGEESKTPKEPAAVRIARDAPMRNGEHINVPNLPEGIIIPARKKGPGRPPKDGVMSKREKALLIKQEKEREKAIKMGLDPSQIPILEQKPPKPRPRKNSQGEEIDDDGDDKGEGHEKKVAKAPKPPRSPSPEMNLADYTEEQLQRPSPNYVYLIYEAIQNSKAGVMNLQQIYSAIERKYPYFKFKVTSNGWQSSVRHNLGQHEVIYSEFRI
jgi:hypothetical protein